MQNLIIIWALSSPARVSSKKQSKLTQQPLILANARCWHNMGNVLKAQGKLEEAIKANQQLLPSSLIMTEHT